MDTLAILGIIALVALAAILLFVSSRRRDAGTAINEVSAETRRRDRERVKASVGASDAEATTGREVERAAVLARRDGDLVPVDDSEIEPWVAPDPEVIGVARRQFLNRAIIAIFGLNLTGFGLAVIAQLWPGASEGFGSKIKIGPVGDVAADIQSNGGFLYKPEGRMWITEYPATALAKATAYDFLPQVEQGLQAGVVALFLKCPHLGCRVPSCATSQWFEGPCHGSKYNRVGEKRGGPAPRGMDRFAMEVNSAGELIVKTAEVIQGPAIGTNTTGQEAEGPNCIGEATH